MQLEPYLGQTVQFPLGGALAVKKGDIVALTVPTWAPVLTQLLSDGSRVARQPAQGRLRQHRHADASPPEDGRDAYRCNYTARLTYSATLVTRPTASPSRLLAARGAAAAAARRDGGSAG